MQFINLLWHNIQLYNFKTTATKLHNDLGLSHNFREGLKKRRNSQKQVEYYNAAMTLNLYIFILSQFWLLFFFNNDFLS